MVVTVASGNSLYAVICDGEWLVGRYDDGKWITGNDPDAEWRGLPLEGVVDLLRSAVSA